MDTIAQLTSGDEGLVTAVASVHLLYKLVTCSMRAYDIPTCKLNLCE